MKAMTGFTLAVLICQAIVSESRADDWPQWLGPQRDGVWREAGTVDKFPADGPKIKWRANISGGFSGPAVAGGRVFVTDYVTDGDQTPNPDKRSDLQGTERVLCFDATSGELLWKHEYACAYQISYPAGPRCTPTIDGGFVYTLGSEGDLRCLEIEQGKLVWERNFKRDFQSETPIWGFCGHPLIDGDRLFCVAGGRNALAVALNKKSGETIWKALDAEQPGYSPPTMIDAGGTRQLLIWHAESLNSLDPSSGATFWSEPLTPNYGMAIATPRISKNILFVGGIVNTSMALDLDADRPMAKVRWMGEKEKGIDPVHSTPIIKDGYMYGVNRRGKLSCVNLDTGEIVWSTFDLMPTDRGAQSGTIFIVANQDKHFLFNDSGELVIAKLSPSGFDMMDRTQVIEPTGDAFGRMVVWNHPAFANRCMFVRNDKELICVSLAAKDE